MASSSATPTILGVRSLSLSVLLALIPPVLYYLGTHQPTRTRSLCYEALFYLSLALLFLGANRGSQQVALLAVLRWICETWATFGRAYRTRFFGALCLLALAATLFELVSGQRVTHYFRAGAN